VGNLEAKPPVDNAYGFEIDLMNIGNKDIDKPIIEIHLDSSAKIIEFETVPLSTDGYEVEISKGKGHPNIIVKPAYINQGKRFLVRIISTGNPNRKCKVDVRGTGIDYHPRRISRTVKWLMLFVGLSLIPASRILQSEWLPEWANQYIGGIPITETIIKMKYPLGVQVAVMLLLFVPVIIIIVSVGSYLSRFRNTSLQWDESEAERSKS